MSELTPETMAEWRKDAKNGALLSGVGKDRRIAVLIDALAAEKAAHEAAEARAVKAEQERDEARLQLKTVEYDKQVAKANYDRAKHQREQAELERDDARIMRKAAERELADLRARIEAVRDLTPMVSPDDEVIGHLTWLCRDDILGALSPTDPTKEGESDG